MKIKSAKSFRNWFKTEIKEIDTYDLNHNENFVGTYHKESGKKTIKGFFEMYHGDKPDIASYLPSILKIAEDGQAIYEFLQNAVDCGSTHFYIFYNEKYFLAINNGSPFDVEGLQSILNIAQTTKKDPDKIGRFGIGFKLAHRLVGKNEGTDELVRQYKGPILFSWAKLDDLERLLKNEQIEPIVLNKENYQEFINSPYLLKILLTNFPSDLNETVKDISYNDKILFPQSELKELIDFVDENFKIHSDSLKKNVLKQGSLFFIKLGEDKKKLLDKDYFELVNGIQYSMNTLKNLQKVYINNHDIGKIPLQLEVGTIKKGSDEFENISPEYKEFDIKFAIGFNTINFGNDKSYEKIKLLKEKPNFYKYFPMGDEINGFGFIVHCDSFSNEANRRKLHEDDINRNLFPVLVKHITQRLTEYKAKDRNKFLILYASLLLSDIPDRQNNKWLRPIFYDTLLKSLQNNVPTKNGFSDNPQNVKINKLKLSLNLSDFGLSHIKWFEWDNDVDRMLIEEATNAEKLGIKEWDIRDVVENANLDSISNWIKSCDKETYNGFLKELEQSNLRKETKERICQIKLLKFSTGEFYSFIELVKKVHSPQSTKYRTVINFSYGFSNVFFRSPKNDGIANELHKLGISLSEINSTKYPKIFSSIEKMPDEKQMYTYIAEKCKSNTLTAAEKKKLFLNFINETTKFDNVAEGTLKDLCLFCDSQENIKPLSELVSNSLKTSFWLNSYKIKSEEYFRELDSYLIQEGQLFNEIILPNIEIIKEELTEAKEIKELITFFKDNHRTFFNEYIIKKANNCLAIVDKSDKYQIVPPNKETRTFIETYLFNSLIVLPYDFSDFNSEYGIVKGENLHSKILELVDVDVHKETLVNIAYYKEEKLLFLKELSEIRFASKQQYNKESYEYKILDLACDVVNENEIEFFKDKIIIETEYSELILSEIPPFADKIKIDGVTLFLSKILPDTYQNSNVLNNLIEQFSQLGLLRQNLDRLFGIQAEPEPGRIFELLANQIEPLDNDQQLAFVVLYNKYFEVIDLKKFKIVAKDGGEYDLTYNFYTKSYNFIVDDATLDEKYKGITKVLKELPFDITDDNQILEAPYFFEDKFICPDIITENLVDEQKISFLDFLFNQWAEKNKKTVVQNIDWSKIDDTETESILGFNPVTSVYPSKYACESEALPDYLIKWIGKEEKKINFLSDLGVWTETLVIIEIRKFLKGESKDFRNNHLVQESRFNEDEINLFNTFIWLVENEIELQTKEQYETFKKVIDIINGNRENNDLKLQDEYDFKLLEGYSFEWKETESHTICLYEGEMPKLVSLDEVEDFIFYRYNEDDYAIYENTIYLNINKDQKNILQKIASDDENDFSFKELWKLYEADGFHFDDLDAEDAEFREGYVRVRAHWRSLPNRGGNFYDYFLNTLTKFQGYNIAELGSEFSTDISKNDQKEANREAKELIKEKLEKEGFEFTEDIGEYSTINGVFKDGLEFPLVVKSYKYQDEPLKIGANEWIQLMRANSMFWTNFGNGKLGCLKLYDLLRNQDKLTISFSTENLNKEDRLGKFAELLHYFGNVHFDFNSVKPSDYSVAKDLSEYRFDERRNEEDLRGDDENLL